MANARITVSEARLTQLGKQPYRRGLVLPKRIETRSLTSLQQRLVKTGGRLVQPARCCWRWLAESHLTRRLFRSMLRQTEQRLCRCQPGRRGWKAKPIRTTEES